MTFTRSFMSQKKSMSTAQCNAFVYSISQFLFLNDEKKRR